MIGAEVEYQITVPTPGGRSVEVTVRLRSVWDLVSELEATGRGGVDVEGAACVAAIEPGVAEAIRELLDDLDATDLDVARAVFGAETRPIEVPLADTYLLARFPADVPQDLVEEVCRR